MGKRYTNLIQAFRKGFSRYYVLTQLHIHSSRSSSLLLCLTSTLQVLTLLIPLEEAHGFQWNYSTFWPVWLFMNSIARPDRVLYRLTGDAETVVTFFECVVGFRLITLSVNIGVDGAMSRREYWSEGGAHRKGGWVAGAEKADTASLFLLSKLLSIPTVACLTESLVCNEYCGVSAHTGVTVLFLALAIALVATDRVFTSDIQWKPHNDGPIKPIFALNFAICDLISAVISPIYALSTASFILRAVLAMCGVGKAAAVYRNLPFHSFLRNVVESFQGLSLIWEIIAISIAMSVSESEMVADFLLIIIAPLLFGLNLCVVHSIEASYSEGKVDKESEYAKAIQEAMQRFIPSQSTEDSLKSNPKLSHFALHEVCVHRLMWTAYYFLYTEEIYFAKLVIALMAQKSKSLLNGIAVQVCIARVHLRLESNPGELTLQYFLSLNDRMKTLRKLDFRVSTDLKEFYEAILSGNSPFSRIEALAQTISTAIHDTVSLYKQSIELFPKKVSLLQAYASFLEILNRMREAEKYVNMITKLTHRRLKQQITNIEGLLTDDPKVVLLVVPLTGENKGEIEWAVNSDALGYTEEEIRGMDYNQLVPEMFRESHTQMIRNLFHKRTIPKVFQRSVKLFIVNKQHQLVYGLLELFGTVSQSTGNFVVVVTISLEPPPLEFGIVDPFGTILECTTRFAKVMKETSFLREWDVHRKDVVWQGEWAGGEVIASKGEISLFDKARVPCVSLALRRTQREVSEIQKRISFPNRFTQVNCPLKRPPIKPILPRSDSLFTTKTGLFVTHDSMETHSTSATITSRLYKAEAAAKRYKRLICVSVFVTFLCGAATTVAIEQSFQINVMELASTSFITSIGMRVLSLRTAIRSKELFLLNSGYTLYGNETKARDELASAADQLRQMRGFLYGNISTATGTFRDLLLEPLTPVWRFERDCFHLYHVPVLDLMDEIAHRAQNLASCPLSAITTANEDFMTLYRNGGAEALAAFNTTVRNYASSRDIVKQQKLALLETIAVVCPIACFLISILCLGQLLFLYELRRSTMWRSIISASKPALMQTLETINSRIAMYQWNKTVSATSEAVNSTASLRYGMSKWMQALVAAVVLYCLLVSIAGLCVYYLGKSRMEDILLYKPRYVDWLGMRRAMTFKSWFHMREAWLPTNLSYFAIIAETQTIDDSLLSWEDANAHLEFLHHCFTSGCKKVDFNHLFPSPSHKDWLQGAGCVDCDTSLKAGLTPLIHELVQLSSAARSDLRAGINSDYSKGKKIEKYTNLLLPSLTTSNAIFDDDTKAWLLRASQDLLDICIGLVCIGLAIMVLAVFPLMIKVSRKVENEFEVLMLFPKQALANVVRMM